MNEQRFDDANAQTAESLRIFRALQDPNCAALSARAHAMVLCAAGDAAGALSHAELAAATFREHGSPHSLAGALRIVGRAHAALGDMGAARHALFDGLSAQQGANWDPWWLPTLLEAVAGMHPDAPIAAALLGGAAALREQWSIPVFPVERADYERCYAVVRATVTQPGGDLDRAIAAGRTLTRDEAIESALALLQDVGSKAEGERPVVSKRPA